MEHKYEQVKRLPYNGVAEQILWKVTPAVRYTEIGSDEKIETSFVVTSATVAVFSGSETYIFPANASGEILNWMELPGSYRGELDHERAIKNVGSY